MGSYIYGLATSLLSLCGSLSVGWVVAYLSPGWATTSIFFFLGVIMKDGVVGYRFKRFGGVVGFEVKIGRHDFDGSCVPGEDLGPVFLGQKNFSVGVYEYLRCRGGLGAKRGRVKVRVSGPVEMRAKVFVVAEEICRDLDKKGGVWVGPRTVVVKSVVEKVD